MTRLQFILLITFLGMFIWIIIVNNGPKCTNIQHTAIFYKAICQSCLNSQNGSVFILNKSDGGECNIDDCKIITTLKTCV